MDTEKYLDNIIKARVELMQSLQSTLDYNKRQEIETMMLDVERSLSRFLKTEVGLHSLDKKDEIIFYEPADDSDEVSGEFAPIHPAEYDSEDDELDFKCTDKLVDHSKQLDKIVSADSDDEYTTISMRQHATRDLCGNE